ncbi:MAG TPA: hypothetical protein VMA32_04170 [Streptosporangiaceae bacterium]|nr:hypothetical protein [Streptosporangiaceae bacterium]
MTTAGSEIEVFTEAGGKRVFASALDWPGWARSGKTEEEAVAAVAAYLPRYAQILRRAGLTAPGGTLIVIERHPGLAKNADFGALGEIAESDRRPLPAADGSRLASLLEAAWSAFDQTAATAPAQLREGPRGGGRDTTQIVAHVEDGEVTYARKAGVSLSKDDRAAADAPARLRALLADALRHPDKLVTPANGWPPRYAARRTGWHVLDHLWEIEDKSAPL